VFISVGDAKIYSAAFGSKSAQPILALSGWIGSWEDWADTLSVLSESWRTISYDHRGSGATIAPVGSITFDRLVDDVFVVLDANEVERCVLAAMSMGALVALGAVLRHPERFSGLVLVNGAYYYGTPTEKDNFLQGLQEDYSATLDRFANACVPEEDSAHIKRWGRQILDRASQEAAIALYRMAHSVDLRDNLSLITQPTLILHGGADTLLPVESSQRLANTVPNARLTILRGAGHVPIMTRPHEVAQEIMSFFGGQSGGQS
jgi:pimeloyl-ACP methyl ester carboxylesterase